MPSPIVAATLQAAGLSTVSNLLAQLIEARQQNRPVSLDIVQLLRFVTLTLMTAPPNYHWQQFLERTFPAYPSGRPQERLGDIEMTPAEDAPELKEGYEERMEQVNRDRDPKFSMRNTLTKWFVDCITAGAIMNTIAFLIIMGILKGQATSTIWTNIKNETIPIIVAGYKIWPIASIISFSFIPVHRRIVFLSFIGLLWGIYMSLVASRV
ncbi:integral membrane Mpv17 PMP22 family [Fusarium albosuccineum]|uniref:Integral membrane Mpv17 PMP22 family n=1 Tax=Fusarium albosuccineum TaxID=1237068 RepID=A0A8H4LKM5_9HYPO|nr:integral membrane Mpv17 PMP22 family [Fusarium albosuccineum]